MTRHRNLPIAAICLVLAAGSAWAPGAGAANGRHGRSGSERALADRAISLDEAVAQAERRHKARAVRAEERRRGDRVEYRIRLLAGDGRVFEVRIDAATGRED
jgi:uncharacterized membrane protein YkoI